MMKAMSSMAGSQPVQRNGIGGQGRQNAGAGENEKNVKHGEILQNGVLSCAPPSSNFHAEGGAGV